MSSRPRPAGLPRAGSLLRRTIAGSTLVVAATDRHDGDVHPENVTAPVLAARQRAVTGSRWVMLDQVHGTAVHVLDASSCPTWPIAGTGDVLVAPAGNRDAAAIWAADCAPVVLVDAQGARTMIHAGWRGLAAGVIDVGVTASAPVVAAVLGPCIHPCCYEFGLDDLDSVARGVGVGAEAIAATTTEGAPALDVPAAVAAALARHRITLDAVGVCTGCSPVHFSHRRRGATDRHAVVSWWEPAP